MAGAVHAQGAVEDTAGAVQAQAATPEADTALVSLMVERHEAALEQAKTLLASSSDAKVRMMASDMMKTLNADLRTLKEWLTLNGAPPAMAQPAPLPAAMPQADKMKVAATRPHPHKTPLADIAPAAGPATPLSRVQTDTTALPAVPPATEDIENAAPVMEFLDGAE